MTERKESHGSGISRRAFVSLLGLGGVAAYLTGCETDGFSHIPDPLAPVHSSLSDRGYAPPVPTKPLVAPPTTKPPVASAFGVIPRTAWTRDGPNMATIKPMNGIKLITFHHSGDPKPFASTDYTQTAQHLEYVREYHRSRKFQDIGYHFAIDRAGRIWQLRSLVYQGEHVRNNNEHNVGIVVLGNFDMQALTQAQKDRIKVFSPLVRKQYGLPSARVYTHKEIVTTECPGDDMQPFMVQTRKQGLL